ncbi:MAG: HepT-like ribonuclease domain-containing protein [Thermosphaera aggregans]
MKIIKLRNLFVHRYWVVDDKVIYDAIKKDFKYVEEFIERVLLLVGGV